VSVPEVAEARLITSVVSVQNRYNLVNRDNDAVLDYCERHGLAFISWAPIASGQLADADALRSLARDLGATPAAVAIAWMLRRSPAILPIPGTSSLPHLEENMAAAGLEFTSEQFAALDAISQETRSA
jgi:aryl-alcohol dehydrogenase-like predicted oxidoreductase